MCDDSIIVLCVKCIHINKLTGTTELLTSHQKYNWCKIAIVTTLDKPYYSCLASQKISILNEYLKLNNVYLMRQFFIFHYFLKIDDTKMLFDSI